MPIGWKETVLKRATGFQVGWTPDTSKSEYFSGDLPWVTIGDLGEKIVNRTKSSITPEAVATSSMSVTPRGSLMFSFKLSVGQVGFAGRDMYTNEAIASFLKSPAINLNYLYYAAPIFISANASINIYGAKILNQSTIANAPVYLPPMPEQVKISKFLDDETARIDTLINKQKKLLELLKEKRQAVISQAVTKGLDPDVPMKDSGVEWLGEVPAHWRVLRLQHLLQARPKNGLSPPLSEVGEIPTFSIAAVRQLKVEIGDNLKWVDVPISVAKEAHVREGDVLLLRGSGNQSFVGKAGIVHEKPPKNCIFPDLLIRIVPSREVDADYLVRTLSSSALRAQVETSSATASGIWKVSGEAVSHWRLPVPPIEEQRMLVEYSREVEVFTFAIKERTEALQKLLRERRSALITAAVTGQIDVTNYPSSEEPVAT